MQWLLSAVCAVCVSVELAVAQSGAALPGREADRRGPWSWFAKPRAANEPALRVLSPQDINRAIERDHRRAAQEERRERGKLADFYHEQLKQKMAQWETRWAVRDEEARRIARERREQERRERAAAASAAEDTETSRPSALVRNLLEQPAVKKAGSTMRQVVDTARETIETQVVKPIARQSRVLPPGHFALLLAGAFFVPSLGVASLILGFVSLRMRFLRRGLFFFLLAGLCTFAVAEALRSPLVRGRAGAVLLPEKLEVGGRVYEGVRYTGHDTRRLNFEHAGGAGSVALADLPGSWQEDLGYDPVRAAEEDARVADAAARAQKLRSIEATAVLATATVVEVTGDGFVIADLVPEKSGAALSVSDSGCAFLATEVRGLRPGTEVKLKLYRHGERRIPGGWGTVELMPVYTDSAEQLLASAESAD